MNSAQPALVRRSSLASQLCAPSTRPLISLYGPPGSGKSYLLAGIVAYPELTANLPRPGGAVLIAFAPLAPDDPLRQLEQIVCRELAPQRILEQLAAQLGLDLPTLPEQLFTTIWTMIEPSQAAGPPSILLIDACEQIATLEAWLWLGEQLIKPLASGPTPACRVVCAQRTPIAWRLPELEQLAEAIEMRSFEPDEIASYTRAILPFSSALLVQLLAVCTAGFPLALAAWGQTLRPPSAAPHSRVVVDAPRHWRGGNGAPLPPEQVLLAVGAALLRSFDRAALTQLFAADNAAGQTLARQLGAPYAAAVAPGRMIAAPHYLRARRMLHERRWLQASAFDPGAELIVPEVRELIYPLLELDAALAHDLDTALAAHYRGRVERDPFRAQVELINWLYHTAGTTRCVTAEWQRAPQLFALLRAQLATVLHENPFADIRLLSDFYTDQEVLLRLHRRELLGEVERELQGLMHSVSEALGQRHAQGLWLSDGQELDAAEELHNPLLRLSRRALGGALLRVDSSLQAWDLAFGPAFDADEAFSGSALQQHDTTLYITLRESGMIVGRTTNRLTPMVRALFNGERTLVGRLLHKQP